MINDMAWIAVDKNGDAWIYDKKPYRESTTWCMDGFYFKYIGKNTVYIIGRRLTWNDDPVEIGEVKT